MDPLGSVLEVAWLIVSGPKISGKLKGHDSYLQGR